MSDRVEALAAHYITVAGGFSLKFFEGEKHWMTQKNDLKDYMRLLVKVFLDKGDGAVYYMWNGTKDSSMRFDAWSYRALEK